WPSSLWLQVSDDYHINNQRRQCKILGITDVVGYSMPTNIRPGAVIFTGDHKRLAKFYEGVTGLSVRFADEGITVLGSETFELVIHSLPNEPEVIGPPRVREDSYI